MTDVIVHIVSIAALTTEQVREIEQRIRRVWGGEEPYICKIGEDVRVKLSERDERIRYDARRGESVSLLSRRYHLHPRRIRQIIAEGKRFP